MNIRTRKLIGAFALIGLLVVYSLAVMMLAVYAVLDQHVIVHAVYFIAAGLLWLPPAMVLVRWMQRPDASE